MAYRIANKYPVDTKARQAVGVSLPFSGTGVFNSTYVTADQLKSNLLNYFMTESGERYMNPAFGGGLKSRIFEQLTSGTFESIKLELESEIAIYFPSITILDLQVYGDEDRNILKVELTYRVDNFNIEDTLDILIQ
jgi:phage baseplate assembly protein W